MLHDRAGLCQGWLSPAGYVPVWHGCAGLARRHLLAAGGSHRFHCPRRVSPGAVLWERGWNLRELTGCEAKKRGARSSILYLAGEPLASPAVGGPPYNGKPLARPAGALLESPQERLPLGLPEASN